VDVGTGIPRILALGLSSLLLAGSTGTWTRAPHLIHPRAAHAAVVAEGAIYVLGGSGPFSGTVERFDGAAWKVVTRLPEGPVNAPAAVALDGRIYVIGGFSGTTNEPLADVEVYDPAANAWSRAAPLPAPRGGAAAVVLDGRVHVVGGGNSVSTIADHSVYDPATNRWSAAAPLPRSEGSPAAVVQDGTLYVIGGRSGFSDFGGVYLYRPARDRWDRGPSIPPRGTEGATVYRDVIYLFGGESQRRAKVLGDVLRLAPGAHAWKLVGTLPHPRNYARAVVYRGAVYVVGGSTSYGGSHTATGSAFVDRYTVR
jgi:N-acetylneuraminic acid mutarotase